MLRGCVALMIALLATTASAADRPNVLVIVSDDQGYADFSCHGNPYLKTPNMDRLHDQSVRLADFHVAPMCTPTRGQLLTGLDALRNRATSVTAGRAVLRRDVPAMPGIFLASGYRTGLFGKWHLGDSYPYRPQDRGFQEVMTFLGWGLLSAPEFDNDYFNGRYRHNGQPKRFDGYCTDFWFNRAMKWMEDRAVAKEPFFCYLPTNAPHGPLWVDPKYSDPFRKDPKLKLPFNFYGMIVNLDENLGRLDAFLKQTGLYDNTLLVYMTDNGGTAGVRAYNAGMRAGKTTNYDGGHRAACFIRWPAGNLAASADIKSPTQVQDLLPTLIDLCNLKRPANASFDGISLASSLRDPAVPIPDRMLIVQYGQIPKKDDACVIWNQWRLVNGRELYDIHADPAQARDVAAGHPQVVARMKAHYDRWWGGVEPTLDDFLPISIGANQENPVILTCSDWMNVYCDNTHQVRKGDGGPRGGAWCIQVEKQGTYEIALRRWPAHTNLALSAPCPQQQMRYGTIEPGKAIPIAAAKLTIAGQEHTANAAPNAKEIPFTIPLNPGKTTLHAWFQDASGNDVCGAYYAYIRRQ